MKTDSLFYSVFKNWPQLGLDFLGLPYSGDSYRFVSEEIKQTGSCIDGLFKPNEQNPNYPLIFAEVQAQPDKHFYGRLFTEITLYLYQQKIQRPWLALVIYPKRSLEKDSGIAFEPFMQRPQLHRIYLEDYLQQTNLNPTHALIACEPSEAIVRAQALVKQRTEPDDPVLNFIETVLVYKLPHLSRKEIRIMLGLDTQLKQTRFYQEIAEEERQEGWQQGKIEGKLEGKLEGEAAVLQRLLTKRFGQLSEQTQQRLKSATLDQLELWADRILDAPTLSGVFDEH